MAALARSWRMLAELDERTALRDRPWEEQFLHWAWDGRALVLHGEMLPPRRRMSTTRGGWCRQAAGRPDPAPGRRDAVE